MPARNICIVDDDSAVRESLRMMLERAGHAVRCFASGPIFLSQGDVSRCGCLVLNQTMPEMTGLALLELLKARGTPCPTILMTGGNAEELAAKAVCLGAMAVLEKPLGAKELLPWIERAMAASA